MTTLYHSISPIGLIALGLLVVQNSTAVLITRYSKTRQFTDAHIIPFNSSSVVVSTEISKLISSLILVFLFDTGRGGGTTISSTACDIEEGGVNHSSGGERKLLWGGAVVSMPLRERFTQFKTIIRAENFDNVSNTLKLAIPAALYTIQNNALYVALNNLDATVFQVGSQSKILTTAVMSVLLLNRSLSVKKWIALVVLAFGIVMTQLPSTPSPSTSSLSSPSSTASAAKTLLTSAITLPTSSSATTTTKSSSHGNLFEGISAVIVSSMCSALAGVYFEKILKGSAPSVWVRNAQLALFSAVIGMAGYFGTAVVPVELPYPYAIQQLSYFFEGYDWLVIAIIIVQTFGGLIVACVVKYTDSILKGFATALAIVVCGVVSTMYMSFHPSAMFVIGSCVVMLATMMYGAK
jgi:UDP-sugar transporter A1/2/3